MCFYWDGNRIISYCIDMGDEQMIKDEIAHLRRQFAKFGQGRIKLKDADVDWENLSRFDRINRGKRCKEYIMRGYFPGVTVLKNKRNHPIEYYIS